MREILQVLAVGIPLGGLYALIALGFVIIYRSSGVLNIAQGQLSALGAFVAYSLAADLGLHPVLVVLLTIVAVSAVGVSIERVALRPLRGQPVFSVILMTLGLAVVIDGIIIAIWGAGTFRMPSLFPTVQYQVVGVVVSQQQLAALVVTALSVVALGGFFRYTRFGLEMQAVADDPEGARTIGVNLTRVWQVSWIISAGLGALAGILLASTVGLNYTISAFGLRAIVVVLLGGLQSLWAVTVAGPIIGTIETASARYLDPIIGGGTREVAALIVLVLLLLIWPYGLRGWKRIERV